LIANRRSRRYRNGTLIRDALSSAREQARKERPSLDERRHSIEAEIARTERSSERYFEAFEQGRLSPERCEQRLACLQARLEELHEQQGELASEAFDAMPEPAAADLKQVGGRPARWSHRFRGAREDQGATAAADRRASGQQQGGDPADLQRPDA
jgi:exonuclease VII small subunit